MNRPMRDWRKAPLPLRVTKARPKNPDARLKALRAHYKPIYGKPIRLLSELIERHVKKIYKLTDNHPVNTALLLGITPYKVKKIVRK